MSLAHLSEGERKIIRRACNQAVSWTKSLLDSCKHMKAPSDILVANKRQRDIEEYNAILEKIK